MPFCVIEWNWYPRSASGRRCWCCSSQVLRNKDCSKRAVLFLCLFVWLNGIGIRAQLLGGGAGAIQVRFSATRTVVKTVFFFESVLTFYSFSAESVRRTIA
ncbi:MAG TPA: hypothetical protein DC014_07575 [Treponema sp.]|nr:hypothetical protein [Treponema sp.]